MKKLIVITMMSCCIFLVGCGGVKGSTYSNEENSITFTDGSNCVIKEGESTYNATYTKTSSGYTIEVNLGFFGFEYYVELDGDYIIVTNDWDDDVEMLKKE